MLGFFEPFFCAYKTYVRQTDDHIVAYASAYADAMVSVKITENPTRIRATNLYILGLGLALGLGLLAELTDPN